MKYCDTKWLTSRAILAPTNSRLKVLNDQISKRFPGSYLTFLSADSVVSENPEDQKSTDLKYPQELLNSIEAGFYLPDHEIRLKNGFIVMLLRNIRLKCGHANGTRYIVQNMTKNVLFLRAVSGTAKGSSLVLPRMKCMPRLDEFPIPGFRRCQFPVRVCFAMTINKAQGQSVPSKLGIDLSSSCFAHGQLYVAFSRATHPSNVYVLIDNEQRKTKNVVYPDVSSDIKNSVQSCKAPVSEFVIPLPKVPPIIGNRDPKVIAVDNDIESCSDYNSEELHSNKCSDKRRNGYYFETIDLNSARDRHFDSYRQRFSVFEASYGLIPDQISCCGITVSKNNLLTVIRPRSWVIHTAISAFIELLSRECVFIFDTLFSISLYSTMNGQ